MRNQRIVIAGVGLVAAAGIGGITAAVATGSPASGSAYGGSAPANTAPVRPGATSATVRTAAASVGGTTEQILVDSQGMPLYYYRPDTAASSMVAPGVAELWPPLTATTPTAAGANGSLTVVHDRYGNQVAYQGHLLYTFTADRPGQVTGQGVQDFFVATPGLTSLTGAASTPKSAPTGDYSSPVY